LIPQATGNTVTRRFDDLQPGVNVQDLYPDIKFSSPGNAVYVYSGPGLNVRSSPNAITRGVFSPFHNHFAELNIQFPQPVSNLTFYVTGVDFFVGLMAKYDFYRNNTLAASDFGIFPIDTQRSPVPIVIPTTGITRVRVHSRH
jgi:hypothetical protein